MQATALFSELDDLYCKIGVWEQDAAIDKNEFVKNCRLRVARMLTMVLKNPTVGETFAHHGDVALHQRLASANVPKQSTPPGRCVILPADEADG